MADGGKPPLPQDADAGGKLYPSPESVPLAVTNTTHANPNPETIDQRYVDIPAARGDWSTSLGQLSMDLKICLLSFCCPVCYGMKLSTEMGESFITPCLVPSWFMGLRQKMRLQQGIPGTLLGDCAMETCCAPCAISQLGREIKVRQAHGLMPTAPGALGMARQ